MPGAARSTRVAVDTNFLLDLAADTAVCWEALDVIRKRLPSPVVLVPPTAVEELAVAHDQSNSVSQQRLAALALKRLRTAWRFQPVDLLPVGHGIVERIAESIRARNYLPAEEKNDSFILAEAALLECTLLVTSDRHLLDIPGGPLKLLLDAHDVACPLIVSPRKIARDFFPKK